MTARDIAVTVLGALEDMGVPHMLVGSLTTSYYGIPRLTQDVDIVVKLLPNQARALAERLGPTFALDPQVTIETITGTTKHVFNVSGTPFIVELFHLSEAEHDRARFDRRRKVVFEGGMAWLPTAEDVVVMKLHWAKRGNRTKDREDARSVMSVQGDALDWPYIESWCDRHGTRELLDEIRRTVPKI